MHDLARYKMGWIRVNQSKHADAVTFFEAPPPARRCPAWTRQKSLNVKREALLDLVYSYTESRPAKGALHYFEKLSDRAPPTRWRWTSWATATSSSSSTSTPSPRCAS